VEATIGGNGGNSSEVNPAEVYEVERYERLAGDTGILSLMEATKLWVPSLKLCDLFVKIRGDSPLLMNRFSEETQAAIEDSQQGVAKRHREPRKPQEEYERAHYRLPDGSFAFPSNAFKEAMVSAQRWLGDFKMTQATGAFFILGDLLPLEDGHSESMMRSDRVVIGRNTTSIAYRPYFQKWEIVVPVRFNAAFISVGQILNALQQAGFSVGIGPWRPEKGGSFGTFHVVKNEMKIKDVFQE